MEGDGGTVEVRTDDEVEDEDGRADGNLIVEEGIFLGKGEPADETPAAWRRRR
jgi:hypothetical protein